MATSPLLFPTLPSPSVPPLLTEVRAPGVSPPAKIVELKMLVGEF